MTVIVSLCLPSILSNRQVPQEGQGGEGVIVAGSSNVEGPSHGAQFC